ARTSAGGAERSAGYAERAPVYSERGARIELGTRGEGRAASLDKVRADEGQLVESCAGVARPGSAPPGAPAARRTPPRAPPGAGARAPAWRGASLRAAASAYNHAHRRPRSANLAHAVPLALRPVTGRHGARRGATAAAAHAGPSGSRAHPPLSELGHPP